MANLGLKTVIETIAAHTSAGATVVRSLTPRLIDGMKTKAHDTTDSSGRDVTAALHVE